MECEQDGRKSRGYPTPTPYIEKRENNLRRFIF